MNAKLTSEDIGNIVYFWEWGGGLSRWCGWEEAKPKLEAEHPEVMQALRTYHQSFKALDTAIKALGDKYPEA